ncbi:pimeloyl-ACP methyl ester carboxylesterase [Rhizobium sp. BK512]|uniref:alpha/beta fold hydrolase n=1 Tax=Rhizobium sp. BK512 TaxID=2587010 RepID=UPI00160B5837|nr:alpha/beta hydrolase [Rhizobium sp. BK512]MBB3563999.1 pimeloyl-ACP methyl ester carboxylesterase [Rhizobium sp. BK512]
MSDAVTSGFEEKFYRSTDGLRLYARSYQVADKEPDRLPIVCLPGLTRNSRDFHELALILSRDTVSPRRVVALDYRGRGLSDRDGNKANYNLAVECGDVIAGCAALGVDRAIFIGTSRGGLILHLLAAIKPELLTGVILNDIGPVIEPAGLVAIRDYLNRDRKAQSWSEAADVLREDHSSAFPALGLTDWEGMAHAIYRQQNGVPVADYDPAIAEQLKTMDFNNPLPDLWPQFENLGAIPLLLIRGENSSLLSRGTVDEMAKRHPDMLQITAKGQGHAPLLHLGDIPHTIRMFVSKFG